MCPVPSMPSSSAAFAGSCGSLSLSDGGTCGAERTAVIAPPLASPDTRRSVSRGACLVSELLEERGEGLLRELRLEASDEGSPELRSPLPQLQLRGVPAAAAGGASPQRTRV